MAPRTRKGTKAVEPRCSVCTHPACAAVDEALAAGTALAALSRTYGLSSDALARHKARHLPTTMAQATQAAEVLRADDLLQQARDLQSKALSILDQAEEAGDLRTAVAANREARGCLELLARLLGEIDNRPQVNLFVSPQWTSALQVVMVALQPYPDARIAVADRLAELAP